jgi:hypothetical protein
MTTPYTPTWLVPSTPGMLCNFYGSNAGTYETPPAPHLSVDGFKTSNLPAGSYSFVMVTSGPGGVSNTSLAASIIITINQAIDIGMTDMPDDTWPVYRLYLTSAPGGVTLGEVPLVDADGTGAAVPLNAGSEQQGYNVGADNWLTAVNQCTGVGAPTGPGNYDAIPLTLRYSNPNQSSKPAAARLRVTRVGRNGTSSGSEDIYDGGWVGNVATQAAPNLEGSFGPNGAVYYPKSGRVYLLLGNASNYFPYQRAGAALLSAPAAGGSVGTWRLEAAVPSAVAGDTSDPGGLCIINGYLYTVTDGSIWYAQILGDGSVANWAVATPSTYTGGGGETLCGFDTGLGVAPVGTIFVFNTTSVNSFTVNPDGTLAFVTNKTLSVAFRRYGAAFCEPSNTVGATTGYLVYMGGQDGSSVDQSTIFYIQVDLGTGTGFTTWTTSGVTLPAAMSHFACAHWGAVASWPGGESGGVLIAGGVSGGVARNQVYEASFNTWYTQSPPQFTQVGTLPTTLAACSAAVFNDWPFINLPVPSAIPNDTRDTNYAVFGLNVTYGQNGYIQFGSQVFHSGTASELTGSQLGQNGSVVNNSDGTVDVTLYVNAQPRQSGPVNAPLYLSNGDQIQCDVQFLDQSGDPSPWASTIINIGQPPGITGIVPTISTATGKPTASFQYLPGAGGGLQGTWRLQVYTPSSALVFDTGTRVDQTNVVVVNTAPLLLSGTQYTFVWTVASTDTPMNDGHSTNLIGTTSLLVTPSYNPPPPPLNFAVTTDSTRCAALPSWTNPMAGPALGPSPAQADPTGASSLLPGTYSVAYTFLTTAGYETSASPVGSVSIADLLAPALSPAVVSADPTGAQGLVPGSYSFVQTYTNSAGETTVSPTAAVVIADVTAPSAPVVAQAEPTGAAGLIPGSYTFVQTYTNTVGETTASSTGNVTIADIAAPSSPSLAQSAASSAFTSGQTIHVRIEYANTVGRTTPSADTSIVIATNGNKVTTTITLPSGSNGMRLFVGTSSSCLALADIDSAGTVTFLGGKSSGVTVVVSGGLQLTITETASGTGNAQDGTNTAHRVIQWTPPSLPAGRTSVKLYLTVVPGGGPALGFEASASTTTPILITGGGNGTSAPGSNTAHRCIQWTPPSLPSGATSVKLYLTVVPGGGPALGFETSATTTTPIAITTGGNGTAAPGTNTAHRVISVPAITLPGGVSAARWYLTSAPGGVTAGFEVQNGGGPTTISAGGNGVLPPATTGMTRIYYRRNGTTPWYLLVDAFVNYSVKVEAESGVLAGGASIHSDHSNYSGSGFVPLAATGNADTLSVTVPTAGTYTLDIRYANGQGVSETLDIVVNGGTPQTVTFPATANWDTWGDVTTTVTLSAGVNTIEVIENSGDTGHFNVDYIVISAGASSAVLMDQLAIGAKYDFAISAVDTSGGMESAMTAAVSNVTIPNPANGATVMLHIQGHGPSYYVPLMATGGVKVKGFLDVQPAPMFGLAAPTLRYGITDFREFDMTARLIDTSTDPLGATTYTELQGVFAQFKQGATGVLRTVAGTMMTVGLSVITSSATASLYDVSFLPSSYLAMREITLSFLQIPNQYQPSTTAGSALGMLPQVNGSVTPLDLLELAI